MWHDLPFTLKIYKIYTYKSDYINEAKKHLNSVDADGNRIYKELSYDCTTEKFVCGVAEAIGKAAINKVIDDELANLLLVIYIYVCVCMVHSNSNLKTNHTCKLINVSNQPSQFNQQEGSKFKTFT